MNRVSVIMGAYNVEKTLERAIESILAQTYKNWIFIICDDGSTDRTYDILKMYNDSYPGKFFILKNNQNRGLTYTLNHCLKYVKTEYIARMDADDISLPNRLKKQVNFLDNHKEYSFVGCAIERFDEGGVWKKCSTIVKPTPKVFYKSSGFVHPTIMMRKSAIEQVKGYREAWYTNRCEDYDLWMRMYSKGLKGYNLPEILFQYYEGKDSFPKRKYKYRIGEAVMRAKGYANLQLYPMGIIYVLKPLAVGLLPTKVVKFLHKL